MNLIFKIDKIDNSHPKKSRKLFLSKKFDTKKTASATD